MMSCLSRYAAFINLLQMFTKQTRQNATGKYLKNSFFSKMFERKMTQSSVEPAENKSFSSVDVNCTISELAVWLNCLNRRASFPRRRQTDITFFALHGATTGIIFTCSFFELVSIFFTQLGRLRIWLSIGHFLCHIHKSSKDASEVNRTG